MLHGRFQLFSLQWVGGALVDPDILRRVYHSSQVPPAGFNRGYYSNPEVDRLLDAAAAATSDEERRRLYSDVQRLVAERRGVHPDVEQDERGGGAPRRSPGSRPAAPTGDCHVAARALGCQACGRALDGAHTA